MELKPDHQLARKLQVFPRPTAAIPMENPYCSCKQSLWAVPAAAATRVNTCPGALQEDVRKRLAVPTEARDAFQNAKVLEEKSDWTAAIAGASTASQPLQPPITNPYCSCSCRLTRVRSSQRTPGRSKRATRRPSPATTARGSATPSSVRGLQLQSLWKIPTAAASTLLTAAFHCLSTASPLAFPLPFLGLMHCLSLSLRDLLLSLQSLWTIPTPSSVRGLQLQPMWTIPTAAASTLLTAAIPVENPCCSCKLRGCSRSQGCTRRPSGSSTRR